MQITAHLQKLYQVISCFRIKGVPTGLVFWSGFINWAVFHRDFGENFKGSVRIGTGNEHVVIGHIIIQYTRSILLRALITGSNNSV